MLTNKLMNRTKTWKYPVLKDSFYLLRLRFFALIFHIDVQCYVANNILTCLSRCLLIWNLFFATSSLYCPLNPNLKASFPGLTTTLKHGYEEKNNQFKCIHRILCIFSKYNIFQFYGFIIIHQRPIFWGFVGIGEQRN